ncbi:group II intron reverse transcriptase/maturase [Desulfotomaculum sp. 1211_IL3151]|uniref:group II intron reverse transcriptase/maturase n=1 Tax=Desulfotomaculum sp. 1211_IL3151 TaxID=3084055 RepID=UPI002FDB36F5
METKLAGIARVAKERPQEKFTSLAHLINAETLMQCHFEMKGNKASGVDQVTKEEYESNLDENLQDLVSRMKRQAYRPQPTRRTYIPKPGSDKKRPLGIPAYEDKLVQAALAEILSAIYEQEFLNSSFGFRPNRGCYDALRVLNKIVIKGNINYIVDVDIKGFFDHVNHEWLIKFLEHRISDPNIIRLVKRFLKAGIMEEGKRYETAEGTPQGGLASPILSNIYLHYVIDLWFEKKVRKQCKGDAFMVRYADDNVFCFQYEQEAKHFYQLLQERLGKFGLEISLEKSKIIPFGRNIWKKYKDEKDDENKPGSGRVTKPETFDFLGFTHYCSQSLNGKFRVKRKTSRKKYQASLLRCKLWIQANRHMPISLLMEELRLTLQGYYRYYGVTDNSEMPRKFLDEVKKYLFKNLNRRSQRRSCNWNKFTLLFKKYPLPSPRIYVNIFELRAHIGYIK